MRLLIGHRITGPLGVVTDTRFVRCFWPALDQPTKLFDEGSKGIEVLGSARNVWFPDDTVWLDYYPDALYPAEMAVKAAFPKMRGLVNLTDEQALIWQTAYDDAVKTFPPTHAIHSSPRDCLFLRHKQLDDDYVSEVTTLLAADIADGKIDPKSESEKLEFRKITDPHPSVDPGVKVYEAKIVAGDVVLVEKGTAVISPAVP